MRSVLLDSLCPGDVVIQNAADDVVGVVVLQLCKLLQLECISIVESEAAAERLRAQYGAAHVLVDDEPLSGGGSGGGGGGSGSGGGGGGSG
eukprot:SAG22_NODE_3830_length_1512_cov_75.643312_1_plen_90_part_10